MFDRRRNGGDGEAAHPSPFGGHGRAGKSHPGDSTGGTRTHALYLRPLPGAGPALRPRRLSASLDAVSVLFVLVPLVLSNDEKDPKDEKDAYERQFRR